MQDRKEESNPSIPNPLKQRDPDLVKSFAAFRSRIGDILLDSLAPLLADPIVRARHAPDVLADLFAAAQILKILVRDKWTEQDLDTFDAYWRDAIRSELFAEQFECERHKIKAAIDAARTTLVDVEPEATTKPSKVTQRTLW